jgi:hypothetical protein
VSTVTTTPDQEARDARVRERLSADVVDAVGRRTVARVVGYGDDSLWDVLLTSDQYRAAMANMRRDLRGGCDQ